MPTENTGSNGKVTPNRLNRPPWKRMRWVVGSCTTLAATIFQLGFLGQPAGVVTGQGEYTAFSSVVTPLTRVPLVAAIRPPVSSTTRRFSIVPSRKLSVSVTFSPISLSPCGLTTTTLPVATTAPVLRVHTIWSAAT